MASGLVFSLPITLSLFQRNHLKTKAETLLQVCGDAALALIVEDMSLMPAFKEVTDGRAAPTSENADDDSETLLQQLQLLLVELREIESFLSSIEGMSASKEDIIKKYNDLTFRMQVKLFFMYVCSPLKLHGAGACGIADFQGLS